MTKGLILTMLFTVFAIHGSAQGPSDGRDAYDETVSSSTPAGYSRTDKKSRARNETEET